MMEFRLGIDSTDSATLGMCTTYLGARVLEALDSAGAVLTAPPDLVRLNPNVPWKTRGNGAVGIGFRSEKMTVEDVMDLVIPLVESLSVLEDPQTNPGLAVVEGGPPVDLVRLYQDALHRIVEIEDAIAAGTRSGATMFGYKNGRGLIGALSAIGAGSMDEWTYELIAYRDPEDKRRKRSVDPASVALATKGRPETFFNVDENGEPVCIPHSPCPVLFGIRALSMDVAFEAASEVRADGIERWVLWRTNQHTDAHISGIEGLDEAADHSSVSLEGTVVAPPRYHAGSHLSFPLHDGKGYSIECWAYEPTKGFRDALSGLVTGDRLRVWGSIRPASGGHPRSLNLEKVEVKSLDKVVKMVNPRCPRCGSGTESMGAGQGLRCRSCGNRDGLDKVEIDIPRDVRLGPIEPPMAAWRHLYRPTWLVPARVPSPGRRRYHGTGPITVAEAEGEKKEQ